MRIILFILLFLSLQSEAQQVIYQGSGSTITGFRGGLLVDSNIYLPRHKTAGLDTALLGLDATQGKGFKVTKTMIQQWAIAGMPGVTLQQVIDNGNDLDKPSAISFGSNPFTLDGQRLNLVNDTVYSDGLIEYTSNRRNEYLDRTIPDWGNVKDTLSEGLNSKENAFSKGNIVAGTNVSITGTLTGRLYGSGNITINATQPSLTGYVQFSDTLTTIETKSNSEQRIKDYVAESSFDTVMTTTVTSLSSPRFSREVETITYKGLTYNSDYFTQAGTTITLTGLIFYNNQKLTIRLR